MLSVMNHVNHVNASNPRDQTPPGTMSPRCARRNYSCNALDPHSLRYTQVEFSISENRFDLPISENQPSVFEDRF